MKKFLILVALCGCTNRTEPVKGITQSAETAIVALEKNLAEPCRTDSIMAQIAAIKSQISTLPKICDTRVRAVEHERDKWQVAFFSLIAILSFIIIKKII